MLGAVGAVGEVVPEGSEAADAYLSLLGFHCAVGFVSFTIRCEREEKQNKNYSFGTLLVEG